jgi:hypothetical protein
MSLGKNRISSSSPGLRFLIDMVNQPHSCGGDYLFRFPPRGWSGKCGGPIPGKAARAMGLTPIAYFQRSKIMKEKEDRPGQPYLSPLEII